jgi:hypothetical protein
MTRRLVFATPFVVIACSKERPVEHPREEEEVVRAPAPKVAPEPEPVFPSTPRELVDALPPLHGDTTIEAHCRRVRCNPPPPYRKTKPDPVVPVIERVSAMTRDAAGTRVRVDRSPHMDTTWRAAFVTNRDNPTDLPGGECKIVAWDWTEAECVSALSPEELAINGHARPLRLVPPQALVDRVQSQIDNWRDPVNGPTRVRVLATQDDKDGVLLTIAIGSRDHVAKTWTITTKSGGCEIVGIAENHTACRAKMTRDQVYADPFVTVSPPR